MTINDGARRFESYNQVKRLYETVGPERLRMLQTAIASLQARHERATGLSFTALELALDRVDSQSDLSTDSFQRPGRPASALRSEEQPSMR